MIVNVKCSCGAWCSFDVVEDLTHAAAASGGIEYVTHDEEVESECERCGRTFSAKAIASVSLTVIWHEEGGGS